MGEEGESRTRAQLLHELRERVKELTVLHAFARILHEDRAIDAGLFEELARLLPPAWQHPDVCAGRVHLGDVEGASPGFRATPWVQRATFTAGDGRAGGIEVVYLDERPDEAEGPFLREERALIQSLVDMLAGFVERQHASAAHRSAERKFALLFEAAPVGFALVDTTASFRIVDANEALERLLGRPRAEVIGKKTTELGLWPDPTQPDLRLERLLASGHVEGIELSARRSDGEVLPLRYSARVLDVEGVRCLLVAVADVSEHKRAEASIRASAARLRRVIDSPIVGFAFAGAGDVLHDANEEALRLLGVTREALVGGRVRFGDVAGPDRRLGERAPSLDAVAAGPPIEMDLVRRDGSSVPVLVGASRLDREGTELVALLFDLTPRRALQQRLLQAQRLEAVGRLAAGVAHDFNNYLSAITISSELLRMELPRAHSAADYAGEILAAAERAAGLTRQLLAFSRQQVMEPRILDLDALVVDLRKLLERIVGDGVAIEIAHEPGPATVRADPTQIQQVLLNLVVNARDAMRGAGTISIRTTLERHEHPAPLGDDRLPAGAYVALCVEDSGPGIPPDVLPRIFDPFFSTKASGRGTGLGLATVYGIVRQSGGAIEVGGGVGRGARFRILLPAVALPAEPIAAPASVVDPNGRETILVVEDDALLRKMLRRSLEALGYTVLEAGAFAEALEVARGHGDALDLVLADLVMPGGNGRVLAERLVASRPDLRVVLMSGYTDDIVVQAGGPGRRFGFLQKPFSTADLARRIREALDRGGQG